MRQYFLVIKTWPLTLESATYSYGVVLKSYSETNVFVKGWWQLFPDNSVVKISISWAWIVLSIFISYKRWTTNKVGKRGRGDVTKSKLNHAYFFHYKNRSNFFFSTLIYVKHFLCKNGKIKYSFPLVSQTFLSCQFKKQTFFSRN